MITLSLILPVHNQEEIIKPVISNIINEINKLKISYEILIIENGSTDQSFQNAIKFAEKNKHIKVFKSNKGYGNAILYGIKKSNAKYISYMPSDGQVDMNIFPIIWSIASNNKIEIVKVKRKNRESPIRSLLSVSFSLILKLLFNTPLIDINGSPRILNTQNMDKLKLKSTDSFIDAEMLIKAKGFKWEIIEIPMKNLDRYGGKSSRNIKTYFEFIFNILNYRIHKFK